METISVQLDGNKSADLQVEEFQPYEPSAYAWEAGWVCYDLNNDTEYFISESGVVYRQPENNVVGVAPAIKAAADRLEQQMEDAQEDGHDYGWNTAADGDDRA